MRAAAFLLLLLLAGCGTSYRDTDVPISSAAAFDPVRYEGLWYEIARFPVFFQEGCVAVTAEYELRNDGSLGVLNSCRDGALDGPLRTIAGEARVTGPGRLEVRLGAIPFAAPYWVLWVDDTYETAVVGVPSGRAGWVLARTPTIRADRWEAAREVLSFNGYDVSALRPTLQGAAQDLR